MLIYTGIGSRETPQSIQNIMFNYAKEKAQLGYTLRSGGADGADLAFELGSDSWCGIKEIYIPWRGFNGSTSTLYLIPEEAFSIAEEYHPRWDKLSQGAQKLMARNVMQVLGEDLKTPTNFVVCWTKDGKASGGTGQALRIAEDYNIPTYNLYNKDINLP